MACVGIVTNRLRVLMLMRCAGFDRAQPDSALRYFPAQPWFWEGRTTCFDNMTWKIRQLTLTTDDSSPLRLCKDASVLVCFDYGGIWTLPFPAQRTPAPIRGPTKNVLCICMLRGRGQSAGRLWTARTPGNKMGFPRAPSSSHRKPNLRWCKHARVLLVYHGYSFLVIY